MKYQLANLSNAKFQQLGQKLSAGQIAVIPTDTQYGIVTSALNQPAVERIYQLRKRSADKPMIILISEISDIKKFGIILTMSQLETLTRFWPNPLSIIIPSANPLLQYLHRGKKSIAFRLPRPEWLQNLLKTSGPLVAPSANFEGEPPASTIAEAEKYFSGQIDFYLDLGKLNNPPSTVIKLNNTDFEVIRQGTYQVL